MEDSIRCVDDDEGSVLAILVAADLQTEGLGGARFDGQAEFDGISTDVLLDRRHSAFHDEVPGAFLIVTQLIQLAQRLDAQHAVVGQAQFARQRLDAAGSEGQAGTAAAADGRIDQPGSHHAAAIRSHQGFRGEEMVAVPAHQAVKIRQKLLVLEVTQIVTAAEVVADAQQHPLLADLEGVGAGDIFPLGHAEIGREVVMQQRPDLSPCFEVGRLHQDRVVAAAERIVLSSL